MLFSSIPGLAETKQKLIQASRQDHLAHALLFHGPEGSAVLPMALALANYINCEAPTPEDACGECPSCQKTGKLIHPDLNFSFPLPGSLVKDGEDDAKKKVDVLKPWRSFVLERPYGNLHDWISHSTFDKQLNISKGAAKQIIQTLSLKSFEGGYKTMLIWCPELMHVTAANALLKILEEPPEKTLFLMVSHHPEQLLTTILSRTQKVLVRGFTDEEIKTHLIESNICNQALADQLAPLADGSMREAFRLADEIQDENTARFRDWLRNCFSLNINQLATLTEEFSSYSKESQKSLMLTGLNILRECLLNKSQLPQLMRTPDMDREFIGNLATNVLTENKILRLYDLLGNAHYHLERNANAKILFTDLSFSMSKVIKQKSE